jgi:hypothetical protein
VAAGQEHNGEYAMNNLWQALRRHCQRLWQRRGRMRDRFGLFAARRERAMQDSREQERARFWDELHQGQREAEKRCSNADG